jgi:DNA-3-methyladenine glycosylase II
LFNRLFWGIGFDYMHSRQFAITPPFNLDLSLKLAGKNRFESSNSGGNLEKFIHIDGNPVLVVIGWNGNVEHPQGEVSWLCPEGNGVEAERVVAAARHIVSAALDLKPFYKVAAGMKRLGVLAERLRGLKPILTHTVFEAAASAIIAQQVNLRFAHILKQRLIACYGGRYALDGKTLHLFPLPHDLSGIRSEALRDLQFSGRKSEYLIGLSRDVLSGGFNLECLDNLEYEDAVDRLLGIRGIGVWSANYILMRSTGHTDCLPLGDSGLHRAVRKLYRLGISPDNTRVARSAERFRPDRSLYTLYLWYFLMEELDNG